jgi:CheY-like chemotaxis protein
MTTYRVLIVDDQREVRRVLRAGIETLPGDFKVTDVPSGEEAILVISRQPVDLLIADVRLPGISGLELKERAQLRNPDLKLILITGLTDTEIRQQIANAGVDAFFYKPISIGEFLAAVQKCLSLSPESSPQEIEEQKVALAEPPAAVPSLSERLFDLRHDLAAVCTMLLDGSGQVMAQAGDLPEEIGEEEPFISSLLAAYGAASRISSLLRAGTPRDLMAFIGNSHNLFLTHVWQPIGLLIVTPNTAWDEEMAGKLLLTLQSAVRDLSAILDALGVTVDTLASQPAILPVVEADAQLEEETLPELEAIIRQLGKKPRKKDADEFWDTLTAESPGDVSRSDGITYDQARQLGLAPEE